MNIEEVRDYALSMNKKHWSDLILERLDDSFVKEQIKASYNLVVSKLPKKYGIKIKE
jgi:predicted DNA-binding protein (MmcQ/YjbR family)